MFVNNLIHFVRIPVYHVISIMHMDMQSCGSMNITEVKMLTHFKLMMSWGASPECDITQVCYADPEIIKLSKLITSRKIVDHPVWTTYRMAKLKLLLNKIAAEDNLIFDCKQVLSNMVIVHWYNDNSYTVYRLTY